MAYVADKDTKKFYSIGEVAQLIGESETLLRYWEKVFPSINPRKSGRNVRQYTKEDIEEIRLVHNLVKVRGMKLEAARDAIRKNREGVAGVSQVMDKLLEIRAELVSIKKELDDLA